MDDLSIRQNYKVFLVFQLIVLLNIESYCKSIIYIIMLQIWYKYKDNINKLQMIDLQRYKLILINNDNIGRKMN